MSKPMRINEKRPAESTVPRTLDSSSSAKKPVRRFPQFTEEEMIRDIRRLVKAENEHEDISDLLVKYGVKPKHQDNNAHSIVSR
jgi:hypothetical protein